MKRFCLPSRCLSFAALALGLAVVPPASAQNIATVHLVNESSQDAVTVLNGGAPFTTDFRGTNDVTITALTGTVNSIYGEEFGGSTPGNNPDYLTAYLGADANGTGDGTAGGISLLETNFNGTNVSLQYDFAQPLTPADRIVIGDVDNNEQYRIQAYRLVNGTYQAVSLAGWTHESFSGETGQNPDATWAVWNPAAGTLTASDSSLSEPLDVLTPDQSVDRIVFTKLATDGGSADIQVVEVPPGVIPPSAFLRGGVPLSDGVYYLAFGNGNYFGYYSYLTDPHYIYHFDLGYEYVFDAADGKAGVYFYDFTSSTFFYTSPTFPFPYLYDFTLDTVLYYYPDPNNAGHYNTNGVRYFYRFDTGEIITK